MTQYRNATTGEFISKEDYDALPEIERVAHDTSYREHLLSLIREAAAQFRFYEQEHLAKGAFEKAEVNAMLAEKLEAVL